MGKYKILKKVLYIICFFSLITQSAYCQLIPETLFIAQKDRQNEEYVVGKISITTPLTKSLNDYFQIVDTIDLIHNESDLVKIEGCNIQFNLKIHRDSIVYNSGSRTILLIESHISPFQSWRYNITDLNKDELVSVSKELREKPSEDTVLNTAFQSCISYALEGIFRSHGINPEPFFFRRSDIANHDGIEVILKNLFVKIETLNNIKNKTLKKSKNLHQEQIFLLFRNSAGEPMHACFNLYGKTWTKNGLRPYTSHPSPHFVIDNYNGKKKIKSSYSESTVESLTLNTVNSIEIYRLNYKIFE